MNQVVLNLSNPERLFVGGAWLAPQGGAGIDIVSPSDETFVLRVGEAGRADVDRAVAAARKAFDEGPWPRMTGAERAPYLRRIADRLEARAKEFASAWSLQVGMPFSQSAPSAGLARGYFDYFADLAEKGFEEVRPAPGGMACMVVREPVGVTACVVPWNAPLSTLLLKVAPALAAGCTVIAKPSPETPLEALLLAECAAEAGLPEGVLSVLTANREVSDYLIRRPEIDKVSFTGSTAAGQHIAAVCAERMARFTMELGGKSAAIILDDAKIETVVAGIMPNLVGLAGQQCAAFSRILVSRNRRDEVVEALAAAMRAVKVGSAFDADTQMGPLVSRRQLDRVCGYIATGASEGARLVTGGGRPENLPKGWFLQPTLFAEVNNAMTIAREEIFGPVGVVLTYDTEEESIAIANDTPYGLSGGVFTEDLERAYAVGRRIRTGNFGHNCRMINYRLPYGGFKLSGVGREGGPEGLDGFTELKTIFMKEPPAHLRG